MSELKLSRRGLVQLGFGAAATAGLVSAGTETLAYASPVPTTSMSNAYLFLDQMMDAYAQGSTVRLCQSYSDQIAGGTFLSTAFIYDNALLVLAYLARRTQQDTERAKVIGNALLYAQQHDPTPDGRFRQAYFAGVADSNGVYVTPGLSFLQGSAVGDVAWPGIALAVQNSRGGRNCRTIDSGCRHCGQLLARWQAARVHPRISASQNLRSTCRKCEWKW